jgi:cyclin-dependent kinase 5 activator 1
MQFLSVPNQFQLQNGSNGGGNGSLVLLGANGNNVATTMDERQADSARILSEKNAIEKNLKKHSLFINALNWKRLSSSHGKKKVDSNNAKNKSSNINSSGFRPPTMTDQVHPMIVVNDKKKQQQVQLIASNNGVATNYFTTANGDAKSLLALDHQNANNIQHTYQNIDKVSIPIRPVQLSTTQSSGIEQQQQHSSAPRKTIIQVSLT